MLESQRSSRKASAGEDRAVLFIVSSLWELNGSDQGSCPLPLKMAFSGCFCFNITFGQHRPSGRRKTCFRRQQFRRNSAVLHVVIRRNNVTAQERDSQLNQARSVGFHLMRTRSHQSAHTGPHLFQRLSLIHISEPTRQAEISYAVFCL